MNISAGTRLGHYEIVAGIGAGGMGQVYRARDTRLDRTVAIKVLPDAFAANAQLRARFEREAKVISSLSHPNICTLHDVGSQDGVDFLVMEHLDGETLAEKVARGPLPLADVFRYAIEIAEALSRAHRAGVVHRDLKPSNIMITRNGAKLLDFGLAKHARPGSTDVTAALDTPTQKKDDLTTDGTILGTYQYMSPEQLEGSDADARSDLFAFGAVLYEMLTGKRAFSGKSRASVIAAILAAEPAPIATLRPLTPAPLDRLVRTCLNKDPDERWQSAHDVRLELETLRGATDDATPSHTKSKLAWLPWAIAAMLAIVATWLLVRGRNEAPAARPLVAAITAPGYRFNAVDGAAVISPDGTRIVVRALRGTGGTEQLYTRALDSGELTPLQGTENGYDPFWSPDSQHIAFFADGKLSRIPAGGGPITTICAVGGDPRGGAWSGETILFSPSPNRALQRVSANGGTPIDVAPLASTRGEIGQWRPAFLPDGRHYLYQSLNSAQDKYGVYLGDLEKKSEPRLIVDAVTTAIYAPPGYLLYAYSGDLYAQPFDAKTLEKSGAPKLVTKNVEYSGQYGSPGYSVSSDGTLVLQTWIGDSQAMLAAMAADGASTPLGIDGDNIDLSRDDTRLAMQRVESASRAPDIWVLDLKRGTRTRVTSDPVPDVGPVWSPDGMRIAYIASMPGYYSIRIGSSSGAGTPVEIARSTNGIELTDWSRDGRYLVAERFNETTSGDIVTIDLEGDKQPKTIVGSRFIENSPRLSPDGRFLSYQSNEGGQMDIYVQDFPAATQRWQLTSTGGSSARWSRDGKRIFFVTPDRHLAVIRIDATKGFDFGAPEIRASIPTLDISQPSANDTIYLTTEQSVSDSLTLLTDWSRTLR